MVIKFLLNLDLSHYQESIKFRIIRNTIISSLIENKALTPILNQRILSFIFFVAQSLLDLALYMNFPNMLLATSYT